MVSVKIIFWVSLFIVFYSYLGYGLLLWLYLKIMPAGNKNKRQGLDHKFEPQVSLVIAAYNEAEIIEEKIKDCFRLSYPKDKLRIIFVADGSSDGTEKIIAQFPEVTLLFKPEREGKVAAINRAMGSVSTPFVVFCDANTSLNEHCITAIIQHYQDAGIGGVAGEKKITSKHKTENAAAAGEGLYWKYESFLKKLDSRFHTVVGAAGELFSIRTHLYEPVATNILLDDFIMSMRICSKGYRVIYEPMAFASEAPSVSMMEEQKRKIRISAGGFQSIVLLKSLLNIFKYGKLSFQYISHRVLRWAVCPLMLPLVLITNILIYFRFPDYLYGAIIIAQIIFYSLAFAGWFFASRNLKVKILYIPYYFVFMNVALYIGFVKFIKNEQSVLWVKAKRTT